MAEFCAARAMCSTPKRCLAYPLHRSVYSACFVIMLSYPGCKGIRSADAESGGAAGMASPQFALQRQCRVLPLPPAAWGCIPNSNT